MGDGRTANIFAICALIISMLAAGFTGWQAFEAHEANQFQAQQADLAVASNIMIAQAGDYPVQNSFVAEDSQIVINLNHTPALSVTAYIYSYSNNLHPIYKYAGYEFIGDMPGCTEVNL